MDIKRIYMPDGKPRTYYKGDNQTWAEIVLSEILPDWIGYCDSNWISANHEEIYAPEKRVKAFLDRCGWMLLQDAPSGIESSYKEMTHEVREIPASECPSEISDVFYSASKHVNSDEDEFERFGTMCRRLDEKLHKRNTKRKRKYETRFQRIERLIRENPATKRNWVGVNAYNNFEYGGNIYHISSKARGYMGNERAMDRVLVVDDAGKLRFFTQDVYPLSMAIKTNWKSA